VNVDAPSSMMAKAFLANADQFLQRGDIVLSRSRTLQSWAIRFATGSDFSHAALVFLVPKHELGFNSTFLLESTSRGVGLAKLEDYVAKGRGKIDLVVLRLEGEGFDDDYFRRVRGVMLDRINAGYDYWQVARLALSFLFGMRLGVATVMKGRKGSMQEAVRKTTRRAMKWVPPQFICSGFIQYGFVKAAATPEQAEAALFRDDISVNDSNLLLAITPDDIARSSKLKWRYAIRRGRAKPVKNLDEAKRFISSG
jgi:Permuted papain-like amidase enzyme, YaeF/YiiX, C92 family